MLNLNAGHRSAGTRIDSDRDVLPFPTGGVFGPAPEPRPNTSTNAKSALDVARSIEAELDQLKHGLDRLSQQIDEDESSDLLAAIPFHRFQRPSDSGPHNPAA